MAHLLFLRRAPLSRPGRRLLSSLARSQQLPLSRPILSRAHYLSPFSSVLTDGGIQPSFSGRSMTTRSAADQFLVGVLKSEIDHELQEEANTQGALKGSAGPFEISDKPGTEEVILRRVFGNEEIAVTCFVEQEYPPVDEEHDERVAPVACLHLTVNITKGESKPILEMNCCFYRDSIEVTVEHVAYLVDTPTEESGKTPEPYDGPEFQDLDENLQRAFHDLLKARGLTAKVATYVMDYLSVKEQREYLRWMHNVQTFFES